MRCSLRFVVYSDFFACACTKVLAQNLQQSRGFGNNFKFPEGEGGPSEVAATGNAGFSDDTADDDLYA